jgi:hypothetical protein
MYSHPIVPKGTTCQRRTGGAFEPSQCEFASRRSNVLPVVWTSTQSDKLGSWFATESRRIPYLVSLCQTFTSSNYLRCGFYRILPTCQSNYMVLSGTELQYIIIFTGTPPYYACNKCTSTFYYTIGSHWTPMCHIAGLLEVLAGTSSCSCDVHLDTLYSNLTTNASRTLF